MGRKTCLDTISINIHWRMRVKPLLSSKQGKEKGVFQPWARKIISNYPSALHSFLNIFESFVNMSKQQELSWMKHQLHNSQHSPFQKRPNKSWKKMIPFNANASFRRSWQPINHSDFIAAFVARSSPKMELFQHLHTLIQAHTCPNNCEAYFKLSFIHLNRPVNDGEEEEQSACTCGSQCLEQREIMQTLSSAVFQECKEFHPHSLIDHVDQVLSTLLLSHENVASVGELLSHLFSDQHHFTTRAQFTKGSSPNKPEARSTLPDQLNCSCSMCRKTECYRNQG
eukprot:m.239332 g.239332  ORF g.239332 m.239332 type:complete len:283 (+) comp13937_c0_seq7:1133-1981(+)